MWAWLAACAKVVPVPAVPGDDVAAGVSDPVLSSIVREAWELGLDEDPVRATALGDHRRDARWPDPSAAAVAADSHRRQELLDRLAALPLDAGRDRETAALLANSLRGAVERVVCRSETWVVGVRFHPGNALSDLATAHPMAEGQGAVDLGARLRSFPAYVDGVIAGWRRGLAEGRVASRTGIERAASQLDGIVASDVATWELGVAIRGAPELSEATRTALLAELDGPVREALGRAASTMRDEMLPAGRVGREEGVGAIPDGPACYAAQVRAHTTLDMAPPEIHALGLSELRTIHAEMRQLGLRVFGTDDLASILQRLRSDPALRFTDEADVEQEAVRAVAAAEVALRPYFHTWPATPVRVERVPAHDAPWSTIAWYRQPIPGPDASGAYVVNTSAPETRARYEAAALAFHEAVPGHHTQIAWGQELGAMPAFRRHDYVTAFAEGWALYAERLAAEAGLMRDDYDRLGVASFDAWRASRLVVDTGLHSMSWTREEAVAFMLANTALAETNVVNEVDRYISWPGQALGYKVGQVELRKLRAEAEATLGERFDIRDFHDVVLGGGAVTLPVLRERVSTWVAKGGGRVSDVARAAPTL